jgi:glycosyltransferase involved in cell wall biosynthesis
MNNSLVSIITPCYNQAQYLDEALQSVLEQTYSNWECIVVNDGSTDCTDEIALAWCKKDDRFIYIKKENGGLSSARNSGIERARGDYLQFLDSDDVLDTRKLELSLNELSKKNNKDKNILITNFRRFTENHNNSTIAFCTLTPDLFNFRAVLLKWESVFSIPIHCGFFKSDLFHDFRFPEELKAKEDWIMWLYLFQKKVNIIFINQPLAYYRLNPQSMTNDYIHMQENHIKAMVYIKEIISEKDYIDYLVFELKQKYGETTKLKTTICNYQNSRTFRIAEKIKAIFLAKFFL